MINLLSAQVQKKTNMLYLRRNDKNIEVMKQRPDKNLPYFSLFQVPEKGKDEKWIEIGAFWKAKTGNGYTGNFAKNVTIKVEAEIKQD